VDASQCFKSVKRVKDAQNGVLNNIYDKMGDALKFYQAKKCIKDFDINLITYSSIEDFVSKCFDLSFCKMTYNGSVLRIHSFNDVVSKKCVVNANNDIKIRDHFRSVVYGSGNVIGSNVLHVTTMN
jgi:hypothetical protein